VVLVAVVVMTVAAQVATTLSSQLVRRETEEELLFRGMAYRDAIGSYYAAVPERPEYPRSLSDLLSDPRFPQRRHIRQLYADPTGGEWRLILTERGRVMGVASAAAHLPVKKAHFPKAVAHFTQTERLNEWEFLYVPDDSGHTAGGLLKRAAMGFQP
jgi:hypothetical protein